MQKIPKAVAHSVVLLNMKDTSNQCYVLVLYAYFSCSLEFRKIMTLYSQGLVTCMPCLYSSRI